MFAAEDGTVRATFQAIYMTGWRGHPSQQKAKARGSATVSFKDIQKQFGSDNVSRRNTDEENSSDKVQNPWPSSNIEFFIFTIFKLSTRLEKHHMVSKETDKDQEV